MFKKRKLAPKKIEFYPWLPEVEGFKTPATPASTVIPEWYKNIRPFTQGNKYSAQSANQTNFTIKKCVPVLDAMSAGYTVCLQNDVVVEKNENDETVFNWKSGGSLIESHSTNQIAEEFVPSNYYPSPFKFMQMFGIKVPRGYSIWITHPVNRNDLPFLTLTGFVDADSYHEPINFPFFIQKDFVGIIKHGTPIAQIIPVKRDKWQMIEKKYTKKVVVQSYKKYWTWAYEAYKKIHWSRKSFD
jgi:hypothetical protein